MPRRYLAIVHQATSVTGRIGQRMTVRGYREVVARPCCGEDLTCDPSSFDAVIVFGGPQSAYDDLDGIRFEHAFARKAVDAGVPFLGVCLGAQILASAYGAPVKLHPEGQSEIGYYPVHPTAAGTDLFPETLHVYHWHKDGFGIPDGGTLLARGGGAFPNQAFKMNDKTYGIQFHPEVTGAMQKRWRKYAENWRVRPGAQMDHMQQAYYQRYHNPLGRWLDGFLDTWLR